jgi:hypothetical protein
MHKIVIPCRAAGFFKMVATDVRTGRRRVLADWFPNLITNGGLDQIGTTASWLTGCSVGSSSTPPTNTDTHLGALVASTTDIVGTTSSIQVASPYYGSRVNTYFFAPGVATGTLAEVGVGLSPTALFSHALILNGMGAPTTITVSAGEALTVFYEFRVYPPLTDATGSVTIGGVSYNWTARAANCGAGNWAPPSLGDIAGPALMTAFSGAIGALTAEPSGTSAPEDSGNLVAYTPGSLSNGRTSVLAGPTANFGGISSLLYTCGAANGQMGSFQVGFNNPIPKTNSQALTLSATQSWARGPV